MSEYTVLLVANSTGESYQAWVDTDDVPDAIAAAKTEAAEVYDVELADSGGAFDTLGVYVGHLENFAP